MNSLSVDLDGLSSAQLRELVSRLLARLTELERTVAEQREEIARLEGTGRAAPTSNPAAWTRPPMREKAGKTMERRPGRGKVVRPRVSVEDRVLKVAAPAGSRFKGYETYLVQELVLSVHAIRYRRERWLTPDGQSIVAPLPGGDPGALRP